MSQLSSDDCIAEIQKPHDKVKELTGTEMTLFRPPYGDYNNTLIESANVLVYHVVQWSVDSLDWKDYGADSIVDTVLNHKALGDGAIILMHNGAKYTKDALELVRRVPGLRNVNAALMKTLPGKRLLTKYLAVDDKDVENFKEMIELGAKVECYTVPGEKAVDITKYIN